MEADWRDMHRVLDQHLPVSKPIIGKGILAKGPAFKLLLSALIIVSSTAVIYFAVNKNHVKLRVNKIPSKNSINHLIVADSVKSYNNELPASLPYTLLKLNGATTANDSGITKSPPEQLSSTHINSDQPSVLTKSADGLQSRGKEHLITNGGNNRNKPFGNTTSSPNSINQSIEFGSSATTADTNKAIPQKQAIVVTEDKNYGQGKQRPQSSGNTVTTRSASALSTDTSLTFNKKNRLTKTNTAIGFSKIKVNKLRQGKSSKIRKPKDGIRVNNEWGILLGANTSGTSKLPGDLFFGAFTTFNIDKNWSVNAQVRLYSPQSISGGYTHANESKKDTSLKTINIKDSRNTYSVQVPVYLEYKASSAIRLKAGPVISLPIRQDNGNSFLQPDSIRKDTAYHAAIQSQLKNTKYQQKINYGFSAGASVTVNRFIIEATYLKRFNAQKIISPLGSYSSSGNTIQISVAFKLNKAKR
ncbi:hypothetical protein QN352_09590 [Mucilaginibacter sp. 10I4]|nr:hypothetical protein [Mucilaginibacter sp. 10I4]